MESQMESQMNLKWKMSRKALMLLLRGVLSRFLPHIQTAQHLVPAL